MPAKLTPPHPLLANIFSGKRLVLGVSGGIAIYKACELARLLVKHGAKVNVVMSATAKKMIAPEVFTALTGETTWTDQWQENQAGMMAHLALSRSCDGIIIAPATANVLSKCAGGIADDLLSTLILGKQSALPLMFAPAMNVEMWNNPATQENIGRLSKRGATIFTPQSGLLACHEEGAGRLTEPEDLIWLIARELAQSGQKSAKSTFWPSKKILITLGPTFEKIDPVRGLTNLSSGAMGLALCQAAWVLGAKVCAVAGGGLSPWLSIDDEQLIWANVASAQDMQTTVSARIASEPWDVLIAVAAVADYRARQWAEHKIKKTHHEMNLELIKNPDVLAEAAKVSPHRPRVVVGFCAESQDLEKHALQKLSSKNLDLIIANHINTAFGLDTNEGLMFWRGGDKRDIPRQSKATMALFILDALSTHASLS